ncbi:MAG TPA: response regulator transcription factor [Acidimicrobiales bacterium]|jgi:DNA-binding NarL/FixJ family response regulator
MSSLRIVLAEDNALLREGVSKLFEAQTDVELVGTAGDLPQLLALIDEVEPDVVVTDIRMPPTGTDEGIRAAASLRDTHPEIGIVVLSQYANPAYALSLLAEGSAGRAYLLKERVGSVDELMHAIREVAAGRSVIDAAVVESLVSANVRRPVSDLERLTTRETEILAEMAQGKSNAAIASALILSERAVEKHTNSIFSKLGLSEEKDLNRRVKAVLVYLNEGGWVATPPT